MGDRLLKKHGADYGSPDQQQKYLKSKHRQKGQLMKQFCKLESGLGNSDAFRENFDKIDWSDNAT